MALCPAPMTATRLPISDNGLPIVAVRRSRGRQIREYRWNGLELRNARGHDHSLS